MQGTNYPEQAYLFDLHLVCGGYAYFSAYTGWVGADKHERDVRQPVLIQFENSVSLLNTLQIEPLYVDDIPSFNRWLMFRAWALVEQSFAEDEMADWLASRPCIADALGSYTDTDIAAPSARKSRTSIMREVVLKRDGCRCQLCGKWSEFDKDITMHHIRAFSRGGETTSRNLVPLCNECNQKVGNGELAFLYNLAGIPHTYDLGFLSDGVSGETLAESMRLTRNLMHTRCLLA